MLALLATAVVVGLLGLGVGGIGGFLLGRGGVGGPSDPNLAEACATLDRISGQLPIDEDSLALDDPLVWELLAAGSHFTAAGSEPDGDEQLREIGTEVQQGISALDVELLEDATSKMQAECAGR
ncbi:hypothetical protein [Brachybacterium sp. GCM10030252]|uniref:hypothetical protein n=1 Tax=Brachybacterium sp. GCM10030252 TaxID=3273380 RepID=UPI0036180BB9